MIARPLPSPRTVAGIRQPWLRDRITAWLAGLVAQGFKPETIRDYARRLRRFGQFAERRGVREPAHLGGRVESFVRPVRPPKRQRQWRNFLTRFADAGVPARRPTAAPLDPHARLVEGYAAFLRDHRGLRPTTIRQVRRSCAAFLAGAGCPDPATLRPECVHRFITTEGVGRSRDGLRHCCSALRGFLAHLYRLGVLPTDLSPAVISPRVYKHERCPRFLTRAEVEAVLAAVDRRTPGGKRTYAMLLLLATYGLRGTEVRSLRLDDIDWRGGRIRVAGRKAGNTTDYPLAAAVGDALLDYLRHARPAGPHREVFLTAIAPVKPLASPSPIAYQVLRHLARAGVTVARPGTHSFRYACAQRLLDAGTPLKTIGDYLGHSHPDSTRRYTKIAIDQLREVALGDVEDAP